MRNVVRTIIAGGMLMGALPAHADILPFTGSVTGLSNFLGAEPRSIRQALSERRRSAPLLTARTPACRPEA